MKLPKELTTATPLSKLLAMILFVSLPVAGFLVGMRHQQIISPQPQLTKLEVTTYPTPTPSSGCYYIENPEAACPMKDCGKILICPTPTDDETANWKTYRNDEFGFEIKYPNDFQKDLEKDNYIKVYKPSFASLSISSISTDKNLEEYVNERIAATKQAYEGKPSLSVSKRIHNIVAGKPSIQLEVFYEAAGTSGSEEYIAIESKSLVEIKMMDLTGGIEPIIKKAFDQILSTFKFTQ